MKDELIILLIQALWIIFFPLFLVYIIIESIIAFVKKFFEGLKDWSDIL